MGDITENHSHLFTHMEERYYVPSLAVNAMRENAKLTETGIYLWLDMNPGPEGGGTMGGKPTGSKPYDNVKRVAAEVSHQAPCL